MTPKPPDDEADDLPPAETARARRRDHDAAAAERAGMRTGLAKQFKQVLDTQAKRGRAADAEHTAGGKDGPPPKRRGRKRRKSGQAPGGAPPEA